MIDLVRDYSAKELQEQNIGYEDDSDYTCLALVTGIYKGLCDEAHFEGCIGYNERKADREYDKYGTREYYQAIEAGVY